MGWAFELGRKWLPLLLLLLLSSGCGRQNTEPVAHSGEITINAHYSNVIVPLSGEWAVYWNRLLTPDDFQAPQVPKPDGYLMQPGTWNTFEVGGKAVGPNGLATLRLIVHPTAGKHALALNLPVITRAYRLWVDGRLGSSRGTVGRDPEKEGGAPSTSIVRFESDGRPIEIVLQVSNHHAHFALTATAITIGPEAKIELQQLSPMRRTLFFAGGLAMIAFFCMAVFAFRRDDRSQLYFGLFVLVWAILILIQYDREFWLVEIPGVDAKFVLLRAQYVLMFISLPLACAFFQSLYPNDIPAAVQKFAAIVFVPLAVSAAVSPFVWLRVLSDGAYVAIGVLVAVLAFQVGRAALRVREGAVFVLGGFAALAGAGLIDMASRMHFIEIDQLFMPFGLLAFALSQALHMSYRLVRSLRKVENLSTELDAKNAALEVTVRKTEHLSRQIVRISEEERRRISQDLHDGICQQLTAARLRFSVLRKQICGCGIAASETETLSVLLEGAVNQAYDLSLGLWPVDIGEAGLSTSFDELCRRIGRMDHLKVSFTAALHDCELRSDELNRQLYRIAQEALTNVAKHADASNVTVTLACTQDERIVLTVADDGKGLVKRDDKADGAGLGMRIMEHRAALIGGKLTIADRQGGGTSVSCVVPCAGSAGCPFRRN